MRPRRFQPAALLLLALAAAAAAAQTPARPPSSVLLAAAPPPTSPYELAAPPIATLTAPADRAAALALLDRARTPFTLLAASVPPFQWNATFNVNGFASNNGLGQMQQVWLGNGNWYWTADLNGQTTDRYGYRGVFSSNPKAPVPMAEQFVREAMFWPVRYATNARLSIRSAHVAWQGHPLTCVLLGPPNLPEPPGSRGWIESEYCVDPVTGLLQLTSDFPGLYFVYDYSASANFEGHVLPRAVNIIANGQSVLAVQLTSITSAAGLDSASIHPSAQTVALGHSFELSTPGRYTMAQYVYPTNGGAAQTRVEVVAFTISPEGAVNEMLPLTGHAQVVMQRIEEGHFPRTISQRELFMICLFLPGTR